MKRVAGLPHFKLVMSCLAILLTPITHARAERVGFRFEGALLGGSTGMYNLFGIDVPRNSPVSGTFSYDTTVIGVDGPEAGVRDFPQQITGGFSLSIGESGQIHLSASEYFVQVSDNFEIDISEFVDMFSVQFARANSSASTPLLLLNGVPYLGTGFFQVGFNWPSDTFQGIDEPKLTSDRPTIDEADRGSFGFVGQMSGQFFSIPTVSTVLSLPGDYNRNGAVDESDYAEWRSACGGLTEPFIFADGNGDQQVGAADYVVWRNNFGNGQTMTGLSNESVPEPTAVTLSVSLLSLLLTYVTFRNLPARRCDE